MMLDQIHVQRTVLEKKNKKTKKYQQQQNPPQPD